MLDSRTLAFLNETYGYSLDGAVYCNDCVSNENRENPESRGLSGFDLQYDGLHSVICDECGECLTCGEPHESEEL